ncbi:MAG: alanine--glyoxylate aminotransferase family protein [Candidatus Omnitrophica bacterium]|nr:alanine--glyoxylate aminotransferase family protein [Candidatus Omnitrophota bacterium]MDD5351852.1 alanine--glyoxylate aminotransferase family protein [Candidatus Omnitrophota bacterium]MDD5550678.1 alanine--glyoxylate aminotransferase family protein [Candidatus Omnitrophota bacterium]
MKKNYLLTPGPTPLPPYVCKALAKKIIHHRTPQFQVVLKEVEENLKYVFQTKNDVYILASSGTGAMEAAVANIISANDRAIVIDGGKFGERWTELNKVYGANIELVKVEWGKSVDPKIIKDILDKDKNIKAVFATHCETSTGVSNDIEALGKIVKDTNAILVVDAISSLGAIDIKTDGWSIDMVVSGSQKGLMLPPGLGFISVSPKAYKLVELCKTPRYYFDLRLSKKALAATDTPFTPAIGIIIALDEVLKDMRQETLEVIFARNKKLAQSTRQAMISLGLELYAGKDSSDSLTAVRVPEGIDGEKLVKTMRDEYGVGIAGGQSQLKGKVFRIAHMGFIREKDLIVCIETLEEVLSKMGYKFEKGKGVKTIEKLLG